MAQCLYSLRFAATAAGLLLVGTLSTAEGQIIRAPLADGFARSSSIAMSADEMLGTQKSRALDEPILGPGFPDLWIAEVQFKPVRLMRLDLPNSKTGKVQTELIRYMVYRAIRRDYTELAGDEQPELLKKLSDPETEPTNQLDPESTQPLQMPRFVLETQDRDGTPLQQYQDEISVEIQNAVFQREMGRRGNGLKLLNSIEAIAEIGEPVSSDPAVEPDPLSKAVYGVAVWRDVDPKADFFAVYMSGFTNAYRVSVNADGERVVEEKVVVQRFARPGDEFLQDEMEYRFIDDADIEGDGVVDLRFPVWQYRRKPVQLNVKDIDTILRNARTETSEPSGS
jgi:hypothetical protein